MMTAKQNQKFPFHFFFRFAAEGWGEEAREKCKEIFWFLHTRVLERVRGAHHWSSGFNSKYIRTSFNTHRREMKRHVVIEKEIGETPLMALSRWKHAHPEYTEVSASYAGRLDPMARGKLLILL